MRFFTRMRVVMLFALLTLLAFKSLSCDGGLGGIGEGCDGMTPLEWGQYPADEKIKNVVQLRVTKPGFDFASTYALPLVKTIMGGDLTVPIDEVSLLVCKMCPGGCNVRLNIASIRLQPISPDVIQVDINLPANFELVLPTNCLGCSIRMHTNNAPVTITTNIFVSIDHDTGLLDLRVDTPDVPLNRLYVTVCGALGGVTNTIINALQGFIRNFIRDMLIDMVDGFKCVSCEEKPCPPHPMGFPTYCVEGVCRTGQAKLDKCMLQPLGIESEVDVGSFLADFVPDVESRLWLSALAGGRTAVVDSGLEVGMFGGTMVPPTQPEACTGFVEYPANGTTLPRVPIGNVNQHVQPAAPYHVGIGLREALLDQAGYTLINSGLLCLELNEKTPQIGQYVGPGTFALLLPDLNLYTHNKNPPWILALEPGPPIDFKILDPATAFPDETIEGLQSALRIIIEDLKLNFFALVENRQVRLFTLEIDVEVTAGLALDGAKITPVLPEGAIRIINYRFPFSAVGTPPADAAATFDSFISALLGTLLGSLLGDIGGFEIPGFDLTGDGTEDMFIDIQGIHPEVSKGGGEYGVLYVYAGLRFNTGGPPAPPLRAETFAEVVDSHMPTPERYLDVTQRPMLVLALSGVDADGGDSYLEYQYSMNNGTYWSPYTRERVLTIQDNRLLLQGNHTIWVRARDWRYPDSADATPEQFIFAADYTRPDLRIMRVGDTELRFEGSDNLSASENLEYQMSVNDGEWTEWRPDNTFDLSQVQEFPVTIRVTVSDEAGLTTTISQAFNSAVIEKSEDIEPKSGAAPSVGAGGGCSSSSAGNLWVLALLLLPMLLRRRGALHVLPVLVLLGGFTLSVLATGCGGGSAGTPCVRNSDCGAGEWCNNGSCEKVPDGDGSDGDMDLPPDGDNGDGDIDIDDKPDGDEDRDIDDIDCRVEDCPACYYCAKRTGECKPQFCDPSCPNIPDCLETTGDTCSGCVLGEDSQAANQCVVPRCASDADCDCRTCDTGQVIYCQKDTGVCACALPCQCGENQACCVTEDNPAGSCMTCPAWCAGIECDPGFAPGSCDPTDDPDCIWADHWSPCSNFNSESCQFEGVGMPSHTTSCGCQEMPPAPIGYHGRFSDIAIFENQHIWVSAYSQTYGDLIVGQALYSRLSQGLEDIAWEYIDGIPWTELPGAGPSGPRRGIIKPGPNVGAHTSLALSEDGWPRVSYQDVDNGDLLFIYTEGEEGHPSDPDDPDGDEDGDEDEDDEGVDPTKRTHRKVGAAAEFASYRWKKIVVDTTGDTGYFSHLWLDPEGRPVIAYMMKSNDEGNLSALKLAMATSATPQGPEDFVIVTVDTAAIGAGYCGADPCPTLEDIPFGLGINPSIQHFANGEFWLLYYHHTTHESKQITNEDGQTVTVMDNVLKGNLRRARLNSLPDPATLPSANFQKDIFLGTGATLIDGNVGLFHSAFVFQSTGWYAVSVYNTTLNQLQLVFNFGSGLRVHTLDDGWRRNSNGDYYQIKVGADCDLVVDNGGSVRVLYQDQSFNRMMYYQGSFDAQGPVGDPSRVALRGVSGAVDRNGNAVEYGLAYGFYPSQALVSGTVGVYTSYMMDMTDPSPRKKVMKLVLGTTAFVR